MAVFLFGRQAILMDYKATERRKTGYIASVGDVSSTFESVLTYLNDEFTPGMTKPEVVARLDALFVWEFTGGSDRDETARWAEGVLFPGEGCDEQTFRSGERPCTTIVYWFMYDDGVLSEVLPDDLGPSGP